MARTLALVLLGLAGLAVLVVLGWWAFVRSVETPPHTVLTRDGDFELRRYARWVVAQVERSGSRRGALSAGFGPLAGYIFAKEREGPKVAMTAPVLQQRVGDRWQVRFVMPERWSLERLPAPGGDDVALEALPPREVAAVRFSGRATDTDFAREEANLRAWLKSQRLEADGAPLFAYYDDPLVPGPLRRNEVLLPVRTATVSAP